MRSVMPERFVIMLVAIVENKVVDTNKVGVRDFRLVGAKHDKVPQKSPNTDVNVLDIFVGIEEAASVATFLLITLLGIFRKVAIKLEIGRGEGVRGKLAVNQVDNLNTLDELSHARVGIKKVNRSVLPRVEGRPLTFAIGVNTVIGSKGGATVVLKEAVEGIFRTKLVGAAVVFNPKPSLVRIAEGEKKPLAGFGGEGDHVFVVVGIISGFDFFYASGVERLAINIALFVEPRLDLFRSVINGVAVKAGTKNTPVSGEPVNATATGSDTVGSSTTDFAVKKNQRRLEWIKSINGTLFENGNEFRKTNKAGYPIAVVIGKSKGVG